MGCLKSVEIVNRLQPPGEGFPGSKSCTSSGPTSDQAEARHFRASFILFTLSLTLFVSLEVSESLFSFL